jgi:tetratricopeptide (TPR) repeat protein
MPKPIKKRVTKKTVFKDTEVKDITTQILDFIEERKRQLILIALIIGISIISYIVFMFYTSSLSREAYSLERDAYNYYYGINLPEGIKLTAEERWNKALELYKKSIEVKVTPTALFYLGNCYYRLGDYNNAIKQYGIFIDKFKDEKEMLPLVYQKLASAYFKNNQPDKAIKTLESLANFEKGIFKDTALILEARYYRATGNSEKALAKYKELVKKFPNSPWSAEAQAKITSYEKRDKKAE